MDSLETKMFGRPSESDTERVPTLPKFVGRDFAVYRAQMEAILVAKGLGSTIKVGATDAAKDQLAKSLLLMSLDNKFVKLVLSCKTSYEIWSRLCSIHEHTSSATKLMLQKEFYGLQQGPNERIHSLVGRAEHLVAQLEDVGIKIEQSTLVSKIVAGLNDDYISFVSNWMGTKDSDQTVTNLLPRLIAEEELRTRTRRDGMAFSAKARHESSQGDQARRMIRCYNCNKLGHIARNCRNREGNESDSGTVTAIVAESNLSVCEIDEWILDSGATEHMSNNMSFFSNLKPLSEPKKVLFGQGFGRATHVGDIYCTSKVKEENHSLRLENVLYVPELRRNLLSLSAAQKRGFTGRLGKTLTLANREGRILVEAKRVNSLYKVHLEITRMTEANIATSSDSISVWHQRFGHINNNYIMRMARTGAVSGLGKIAAEQTKSSLDRVDCTACVIGKMKRRPVEGSSQPRAHAVGQYIHSDIGGPIGTPTVAGNNYYILFKDEHSTYRFVFFMKSREEAYDCVKKCIAQINASTGMTVKNLVSDRGSEYTSRRMQEYLISNKIGHITSAPFTPTQNGAIEVDNRVVLNLVRSMMNAARVANNLWGEALGTAVYLLNRCVNSQTGNKTPYELFCGRMPRVSHLKIFGCLCFVKEQHKKRSGYQKKLEDRARQGVFVGYESNHDFTYRIYIHESNDIVVSRDVVFDESRFHNERRENKEPSSESFENYVISHWSNPNESLTDDSRDEDEDEYQHDCDQASEQSETVELPEPNDSISSLEHSQIETEFKTPPTTESQALPPPIPTRSLRDRTTIQKPNFYQSHLAYSEPDSYDAAITGPDSEHWKLAIKDELESLMRNETWIVCDLPKTRTPIGCKWVFKRKLNSDNTVARYKARLVAQGFSQKPGIDYTDTYAPVVSLTSVRLILALAVQREFNIIHFDIKTAFLNGNISEEIYMKLPRGCEETNKVCLLKKSLYGLKQSPRAWNLCFSKFLERTGFIQLEEDRCVFTRRNENAIQILGLYVDDGLLCSSDKADGMKIIDELKQNFEATVMEPRQFVGLEIHKEKGMISIHQRSYIEKLVERMGLGNCKIATTPLDVHQKLCKAGVNDEVQHEKTDVPYREIVGCLVYISSCCRPDIAHAVSQVAQYCSDPKLSHWNAVKHIIRYLKSTKDYGICYKQDSEGDLNCFADADHAADVDTRRSISGYIITLGAGAVAWRSRKQTTVADSTTAAELIATSEACKELIWLQRLLSHIDANTQRKAPKVFVDNQSTITVALNEKPLSRLKWLALKHFLVRDLVRTKEVELKYIESENQVADPLTKSLPKPRFSKLREKMGMFLISIMCLISLIGRVNSTKQYQITHHWVDPCLDIGGISHNHHGVSPPKIQDMHNGMEVMMYDECSQLFRENWLRAVEQVKLCHPKLRYKRQISQVVQYVATSATNFLLSKLLTGRTDRTALIDKTYTDGYLDNVYTRHAKDYINMVSETHNNHQSEIDLLARSLPKLTWASMRVNSEILAHTALMKKIGTVCKTGNMATAELAELIGEPSIATIDSSKTQVESVVQGPHEASIVFTFTILDDGSIAERYRLIIYLSPVITLVLIISIMLYKRLLIKRQIPEINRETMQPVNNPFAN